MIKILLENNQGFKWYTKNNVFVKGYIFDDQNNYYAGESLLDYFLNITDVKHLMNKLKKTNGLFSLVIHKKEILFLAVDRLRMFPIFYQEDKKEIIITDNTNKLKANINHRVIDEFKATGYVTGKNTLLNNVFQVQAGELLIFDKFWKNHFYYNYSIEDDNQLSYNNNYNKAITVFEETGKRLIKSLNNKTAIIPLSGGYDSRFIASVLKQNNYENVVCFTYGRKGNKESEISEKVAKTLDFKWHFIEYNNELIDGFPENVIFKDYYQFSANNTSMFFMQEYFAVKYLKENKLIPDDSVFVPGHSGDFLGGSQITKYRIKKSYKKKKLTNKIYGDKYIFNKKSPNELIYKEQIEQFITEFDATYLSYSIYEDWDMKEKLAKLIVNSSNVYNFFGYEHRLPFWDIHITDFFKILPFELKQGKAFYDQVLQNYYLHPLDLVFASEKHKKTEVNWISYLKKKIRKMIPGKFKKTRLQHSDNLFYYEITNQLKQDMKTKNYEVFESNYSYNSYLAQWYIFKILKNRKV